jgi:hypothetical protein
MGLFSNAPRLAEMDGKKMSLPWYQGNYLHKQEQFISTITGSRAMPTLKWLP